MNSLTTIVSIVSFGSTIVLIISMVWAVVLWAQGVLPAIFRLGNGLAKRKIAIFAGGDNVSSLKSLLIDSSLFREKNIFEITTLDDLGKAEQASVYLVDWRDWKNDYKNILNKKADQYALIVYALPGSVPPEDMQELEKHRNTCVTNFRGRLLNDIVTSMITTGYKT